MNNTQQRLFNRLMKALDNISESPETAIQVAPLFEDFVISIEEIANDLKMTSDKETAATLKAIVQAVDTSK